MLSRCRPATTAGVAYHAQRPGIPAAIVMPRFAPAVKVERTRGFGAEVVLKAIASTTRALLRPGPRRAARPDAGASIR